MPELPEVEVVRRRIEGYLAGKTILEVSDFQGRFALPPLSGKRIERISRHGKCLFFEFSTQDALFVHLGMTGKLLLSETRTPLPHQHLVFSLSAGIFLSFCDQRKFGKIRYFTAQEKEDFLHSLGIDPFSRLTPLSGWRNYSPAKSASRIFSLTSAKSPALGIFIQAESSSRAASIPNGNSPPSLWKKSTASSMRSPPSLKKRFAARERPSGILPAPMGAPAPSRIAWRYTGGQENPACAAETQSSGKSSVLAVPIFAPTASDKEVIFFASVGPEDVKKWKSELLLPSIPSTILLSGSPRSSPRCSAS
jgi:hypothetical protein